MSLSKNDDKHAASVIKINKTGKTGTLDGSITKLPKDGSIFWDEQHRNPISGKGIFSGLSKESDCFIFDECWRSASTNDAGTIIAYGTGMHCDEFENNERLFAQYSADPREIRRSLLIKVDQKEDVVWYKTDLFSK